MNTSCVWTLSEGKKEIGFRGIRSRALTFTLAILLTGFPAFGFPDQKAPSDTGREIIARVNNEPVTRIELERFLADPLYRGYLQREAEAEKEEIPLEDLALRELIRQRLFLQEADRRGLRVTEQDLDNAIAGLRRRFTDLDEFGRWMKERGLDDMSLFDTVRDHILITRVWSLLVGRAELSDEQVQAYYEARKEDINIGVEVRMQIIAIETRAKAERILEDLSEGMSFTALALERSRGTRAAYAGDTGWVRFKSIPPSLQEVVLKLSVGQVYGPLEKAHDEYLIVGLAGRRPLVADSLDTAQDEIRSILLPVKQREILDTWLRERMEQSEIEIFVPSRRSLKISERE